MIHSGFGPIRLGWALIWSGIAAVAFHLAYWIPGLGFLIVGYLFGLFQLARLATSRQSFYLGLGVGLLTMGPQLSCFWVIFGPSAVVLWLILAFWIGLFVALARLSLVRFGMIQGAVFVPFIWTGLEYFRSELYYLKFSWLNIGYAVPGAELPMLKWCGMYGVGFVAMVIVVAISILRPRQAVMFAMGCTVLAGAAWLARINSSKTEASKSFRVAGVQLEFPSAGEVVAALDKLLTAEPKAELLVLSEYTFLGPIPEPVRNWCRKHRRYLVIGAEEPAPKSNFYDTAFVIGPNGDIVFSQAKSVPIQFFRDGLPALQQHIWDSPWGKLGLCICYDLSYTRVTDRLIRQGAQGLIVPTMDVVDWGRHQHELHARVAPVRAAEYGVPIFRLASSGISQLLDSTGKVIATANMPGQGEVIAGRLALIQAGALPWDRWLAPFSIGVTVILILFFLIQRSKRLPEPRAIMEEAENTEPTKMALVAEGEI